MTATLPSMADRPMGERSQIFVSQYWKTVMFCMMPGMYEYVPSRRVIEEPYGIAYRLEPDGSMKEIYRITGWYSHQVLISMDAQYLVRMGPWHSGHKLSKEHVAVEFYKDGKLLKDYSTLDLVKDARKIEPTVSHYFWRGEICRLDVDHKFTLDTIDGVRYVFDATTGKILSEKRIEANKSE